MKSLQVQEMRREQMESREGREIFFKKMGLTGKGQSQSETLLTSQAQNTDVLAQMLSIYTNTQIFFLGVI